jgi:hypothetical protein
MPAPSPFSPSVSDAWQTQLLQQKSVYDQMIAAGFNESNAQRLSGFKPTAKIESAPDPFTKDWWAAQAGGPAQVQEPMQPAMQSRRRVINSGSFGPKAVETIENSIYYQPGLNPFAHVPVYKRWQDVPSPWNQTNSWDPAR